MENIKFYIKKARGYILRLYDEILPEPEQKLAFWIGGAAIFSLFAFMIAALDIGIRNKDCSIVGMLALYLVTPEKSFPWGIWLLCSTLVLAITVFVAKALSGGEDGRNFKLSESDVYGSSDDISDEDLRQVCEIAPADVTDKMILGMAPGSNHNVLGAKEQAMDNPNVAIIGTPGAGKSAGYCIPMMMQIMRRRESVVCSDTKGELYARTSEIFRANGYVVKKLDLRNPIMSNGWNALKEMRHDQARAQVFVNTITSNCDIGTQYKGFAANLLTAISLYVERNPAIPDSDKNLAKVYQMITTDADNLDSNFKKAKNVKELLPAVGAYSSFVRSSDALAGNCINNVASSMGILAADAVQEMLKKDEIDLTLPGRKPCVYYVVMSDQDDTFKFLASLFFAFLFQDLVEFADQQDNQKLPVRCTVLLEEFAQVKIPNIDKKLSTCRSRGIPIVMIVQTLDQLQKEYPDEWETMLDDCAIQICLAANGEPTAKYFERKTGETTVEVKTQQHDIRAIWGTGRYSTGYGKRYYRTADEIRRIPRYHSLIVWQRYNTLVTKNFVIDKHPAYPYMETTKSFTRVPLTDLAAREYIQQYEDNRVRVMDEWIAGGGRPMWYCATPKLTKTGPNTGTKPPKFLSYRKLEQKALQFSQEHPEVNQRIRRQLENQRLAEARRVQRELEGNPILFTFASETPDTYDVPKEKKPKQTKKKPVEQDPNQVNMEEYQHQAELDREEGQITAEPSVPELKPAAFPKRGKGKQENTPAEESHEQEAGTEEVTPAGDPEPPTEKKEPSPSEPFNQEDFLAKYANPSAPAPTAAEPEITGTDAEEEEVLTDEPEPATPETKEENSITAQDGEQELPSEEPAVEPDLNVPEQEDSNTSAATEPESISEADPEPDTADQNNAEAKTEQFQEVTLSQKKKRSTSRNGSKRKANKNAKVRSQIEEEVKRLQQEKQNSSTAKTEGDE